ncbi:MAG: hypothetical protein WBP26_01285 [Candidatus Saccharimonadales bacterium]
MTTPFGEGLNIEDIHPGLIFTIAETAFARLGLVSNYDEDIDLYGSGFFCLYYRQNDTLGADTIYSDWFDEAVGYCQIDTTRGGRGDNRLSILGGDLSWEYNDTGLDAPEFVCKVIEGLARYCSSINKPGA